MALVKSFVHRNVDDIGINILVERKEFIKRWIKTVKFVEEIS